MNKDVELAHQAGVLSGFKDLHPDMVEFVKLIRADEREECAKVCEEIYTGYEASGDWPTPEMCAAAIRARGQG